MALEPGSNRTGKLNYNCTKTFTVFIVCHRPFNFLYAARVTEIRRVLVSVLVVSERVQTNASFEHVTLQTAVCKTCVPT